MYVEQSLLDSVEKIKEDSAVTPLVKPVTEKVVERFPEKSEKLEWGDSDTKLLLDLYHKGLPLIGPFKKFKNKKCLWIHIGKEIEEQLGLLRTAVQCESRFKTIMKRKTATTTKNHTSGETRVDVPYEDEIGKIKAQDDSLEPDVLMSGDEIKINQKEKFRPEETKMANCSRKRKYDDLVSVLENMHQKKEEAKERRHREKMELMKELFREDLGKDCSDKD